MTATSQLPILNNSLVFTDYLSTNEKGETVKYPLPGISTIERIDDTIMLTCSGNIYVGQIDEVTHILWILVCVIIVLTM